MTFRMEAHGYSIRTTVGPLPAMLAAAAEPALRHARLVDDVIPPPDTTNDRTSLRVEVSRRADDRPDLIVTLGCEPGPDQGFFPGAIIIPESRILLIGAGTQLVAYDLTEPRRLWLDTVNCGFWGWSRYGEVVLMSAELELAAFDLRANKLWSTFVEPVWTYEVVGDRLDLTVMDHRSSFDIHLGPHS